MNTETMLKSIGADIDLSKSSESVLSDNLCATTLVQMLEATDQAIALLDTETGCIHWSTAVWKSALNQPDQQGQDESLTTEFKKLYREYEKHGYCTSRLWCNGINKPRDVTVSSLASGAVMLQLLDSVNASDDMHLYMEARETMFTTSRIISVSEMATTLAHEIKQPIGTIINILKGVRIRLRQGVDESQLEKVHQALDSALEQSQFTNSVINRIRDFTQARRPQQVPICLPELTNEALNLMDWFLSANQCRTKLTLGDDSLVCMGDPTMLQQVLINLLRNGVEAMKDRDPVDRVLHVECNRHGTFARISIQDDGHGLSGKDQTLFVPFATSKAGGMGVGLNICRSFVELHQGRLWLSPNSGGGCTSNVELPLASDGHGESAIADQTTE